MGADIRQRAVELALEERRYKQTTAPPPLLQRAAEIAKFIQSGTQQADDAQDNAQEPA